MQTFYSFDDRERAVIVTRPDVYTPWINYLSNGSLSAFVSQAGGGLCWWKSPSIYRLTRYRMYNLPPDSPGFYVYVREADGTYWSPSAMPCDVKPERYSAAHQPGKTVFRSERNGISVMQRMFVAPAHDVLVWDIEIANGGRSAATLDVFGYVEFSLLEWLREAGWGYYVKHQIKTWFDDAGAAVAYLYHALDQPNAVETPLVYFASNVALSGFDADRDVFVGPYRSERDPLRVAAGKLSGSVIQGGEPCGALSTRLALAPGGKQRFAFFLGVTPGAIADPAGAVARMRTALDTYRAPGFVDAQLAASDRWWDEHLGAFECNIPDADAERQINVWTPVQCVHTGRYSRSISSYASGIRGIGFRDTCQDMLAIAYRDPDWARKMFLFQLSEQFADGHANPSAWFAETRPPQHDHIRCDDHLWLPLLAHALLAETGDLALFQKTVTFLRPDGARGADATVWQHLLRAVDFTENNLGAHGMPLTFVSDWNDTIGRFNLYGRGETVFAGQQYAYALRLLIEIARVLGDDAAEAALTAKLNRQAEALDAHAWDGEWWRRGFDDDGTAIGSAASPWGRIFLNPQSWAVISRTGTDAQRRRAMEVVARELDTPVGLMILKSGFKTYPQAQTAFDPSMQGKRYGEGVGYNPGCGENGAIFCHANTWAVIAETMLGNGRRAWKYFRQMIPHVALQQVGIERYQAEPYAYASNILGPDNVRFGFANVTQVTGTAAWMDVAATQYVLGVRAELDGLRIDPCVPEDFREFTVRRNFRGCRFEITVKNPRGIQKGVRAITLDGRPLDIARGPIVPAPAVAGREHANVLVEM